VGRKTLTQSMSQLVILMRRWSLQSQRKTWWNDVTEDAVSEVSVYPERMQRGESTGDWLTELCLESYHCDDGVYVC